MGCNLLKEDIMKIKTKLKMFNEVRGVAHCYTKHMMVNIVYGDYHTTIVVDIDDGQTDMEATLEACLLFKKMAKGEVGPLGELEEKTILRKILKGERHFTL
jgi:hypothetical protein